jgi:glycosyltransferase involved in cell wall biosynthesis
LKIGIDYRSALLNREGIGRTTRELVRALVELGHGAELGLFGWTLAPVKFTRDELGLAGTEARLARFRFPSRWIPDLCRTLGKGVDDLAGGCEVYHHTQPHLLPVRSAVEVATIFDCIYMDGGPFVSPAAAASMTRAAREMVARARKILVPSHFVAREVEARLGARNSDIHVVWLGCDHITRRARAAEGSQAEGSAENGSAEDGTAENGAAREPFVLTVTRVDGRKNHVRMLRVFERLVAAGLAQRWVVAGPDGHGVEAFDAALASSPVRSRVERLKFVDDAELSRLYRRTSLFLFASLNEGFGLPPLEALACGAPVVAGNNTSMPEVLGDAALLVDVEDEDALFDAALRLIREPELAAELRARGLRRASELTWQACARATYDVYREAANSARL